MTLCRCPLSIFCSCGTPPREAPRVSSSNPPSSCPPKGFVGSCFRFTGLEANMSNDTFCQNNHAISLLNHPQSLIRYCRSLIPYWIPNLYLRIGAKVRLESPRPSPITRCKRTIGLIRVLGPLPIGANERETPQDQSDLIPHSWTPFFLNHDPSSIIHHSPHSS